MTMTWILPRAAASRTPTTWYQVPSVAGVTPELTKVANEAASVSRPPSIRTFPLDCCSAIRTVPERIARVRATEKGRRILEEGPPAQLFTDPREERTRTFLKRVLSVRTVGDELGEQTEDPWCVAVVEGHEKRMRASLCFHMPCEGDLWVLEGSTVSEDFLATGLTNGSPRCFAASVFSPRSETRNRSSPFTNVGSSPRRATVPST